MFLGTRLRPAIDNGVAAVKKADDSVRLCIMLVAATLLIAACTLAAVLAARPARG